MNVTVFKNIFNTDVPHYTTLENVFNRIRNGKSKELIEKIRSAKNKDERNELKKQLPCILFSGEFTERNKKSIKTHNGLMTLDFDDIPNDLIESHKQILIQNIHVVSVFLSPSGDGLKAIINIPICDEFDYSKYFKQFKETFDLAYFDKSSSDISRVCYESYDPNIYVSENYKVFDPELLDVGYSVMDKTPVLPLTDEGKIIDKIMKWNWNMNFVEGQRNAFIFQLAGAFCEYGVYESTTLGYINNNIVHGEFTEEETSRAVKSAYKTREFKTKYFEDYGRLNSIKKELHKGKDKVIKKYNISEDTFEEIKEVDSHDDFWIFEETPKGKIEIKIDTLKYKRFLERNGYKKYYQQEDAPPIFVLIRSNIVKEISTEKMKDFVLNYLMQRNELGVWRHMANYHTMFSATFLNCLDSIELKMLKDKSDTSFIYYLNGVLKIDKTNIELIDYIDVDGYVWESQIIKRNFSIVKDYVNDYQKFINNVSNGKIESFESVIGYLISTYKDKTNNKAIILNDEVISENPEGGTGKGLFSQGINHIRNLSILDGKTFDDKKSFPYQTVSPDTNVLYFDDVGKAFDFESKFSLITEGITLERKNQNALKLSVEDSPKILISTNYAIKGSGNSHERRRFEIEFCQHYNRSRMPFDDFGRHLFDDWNENDYLKYDNYIANCVQFYLNNGLITQDAVNIKLRKFIADSCMEFYEFMNDKENFEFDKRIYKNELFDKFISEYSDYKKNLTKKRFNIWCQKFSGYNGFKYEEGNENGNRYFEIKTTDTKTTTEEEPPF